MDFQDYVTESGKIYLRDVSPEFKATEGEVADDDRAWVIIRQRTQADETRRKDLQGNRESKYDLNPDGSVKSIGRVFSANDERLKALEVYLCLKDAGNLTLKGKPIFTKLPTRDYSMKEFDAIWGGLHPMLATALHNAVISVNVDWAYDAGEL